MELNSVLHFMNESYAYKVADHQYLIRLRTNKNAFKSVKLRYIDKYLREHDMPDQPIFTKEMVKVATNDFHDYYEIVISDVFVYKKFTMNALAWRYYFILEQDDETIYYGNYKFFTKEPHITIDMFSLVIHQANRSFFEVPEWTKGAIFYQIFPERFAATNDEVSDNWNEAAFVPMSRTNGTLRGIIQKVDYLKKLGVDAIYINPIFLANTCHRYDTVDYLTIDPKLGTDEDLKELVDVYHKNGIKVVLDLVFNHSGIHFFAFEDVIKNQEKSKYKDWYCINEFPISTDMKTWPPKYQSFAYGFGMPKFDTDNPECRNYLLGVTRHYLEKFNIDGYRLDVADEVTHSFWRDFRKVCKEINKDCLIMGEVWYESSPYMRGDEWDSIMNYNFFDETRAFLNEEITTHEYINRLERERGEMGQTYYHNSNILLGTHDTDRLFSAIGEDKDKYMMAMSLLFFLPGAPIIYYGDEIMLKGKNPSEARSGMTFDPHFNKDVRDTISNLMNLKHEQVLKIGEVRIKEVGTKSIHITRFNEDDEIHMYIALEELNLESLKGKVNLYNHQEFDGILKEKQILIYR